MSGPPTILDDPTDRDLLSAYLAGDEAAFARLMERHHRMVHRVCARNLGSNTALAEDAAQAVFVVLARKARALAGRHDLGGWLYRAAGYAAANARRAEEQRHARERAASVPPTAEEPAMEPDPWAEARPLLDEGLTNLGEAQRTAVVLCLLEGVPQAVAARRLRCSQQAVQQRVASAIERLRRFFRSRGIAIPAAVLMTGLAEEAAAAGPAVPTSTTILHAGHAPTVEAIAQGVITMLFLAKLRAGLVILLVFVLGGVGLASIVVGGEAAPPAVVPPPSAAVAPVAAPPAGPVVNGLRLSLRMDQTEIIEGQPWTGRLLAENAGADPLRLFPLSEGDIVLEQADGTPVPSSMFMGNGGYDPQELRQAIRTLKAGESTQVMDFSRTKPGPYSELAGGGHNIGVCSYRLPPGTYRLRIALTETGDFPRQIEVPGVVWTGKAESNTATVVVRERPLAAGPAADLQILMAGTPERLEIQVRNTTDRPMVIDLGGMPFGPFVKAKAPQRWFLVLRDAAGNEVRGRVLANRIPSLPNRADHFRTLAPGASLWLPFGFTTTRAKPLPTGTWSVQATYNNPDDGLAAGAPAAALVGEFTSNRLELVVP